jgi:hypothetical protein
MSRIIEIEGVSLDIENIKEIRVYKVGNIVDEFPQVIVSLLKEKEYVYNPSTEEYTLFEPEIRIALHSDLDATNCRHKLVKIWELYLAEKRLNTPITNE